jgi:cytochrome c oxidase subunit II
VLTGKAAAAAAVPLLAGCAGPLSALDPDGPIASEVALLWWIMLAGSGVLTLFVLVLLWIAMRSPRRETSERIWIHGLGVGFALVVLTALLVYGLIVGERILPRDDGAVHVRAQGEMWRWSFLQPGPDGTTVATRDTLYLPANARINVEITSEDVIHSFWVPRLGGKMDAMPGRVNVQRLVTVGPGTYDGVCTEFCGLGHTFMRFQVVVYDPDEPFPEIPPDELAEEIQ